MRRPCLVLAVAALATLSAGSTTAGAPEPKTSVVLAKSWEAAVEEAKALNVPIVVHSHGFYCGPCWGMHSSVMCNKKYIDFANESTVEVISLDRLEEGVEKKDKHADTYEVKEDGKPVKYLCEFPGMTVEAMTAMRSSKAGTFNQTGKIPYTCIVDPWTETEIKNWSGSTAVGAIEDAVVEARKAFVKEHGKGASRKDVRAIDQVERDAMAKADKGEFAAAMDTVGKLSSKAEKWSEPLKERVQAAKQKVVDAAQAALDKIVEAKATEPEKAKKDLTALVGKLRGTGLEEKAKSVLAE